MYVADENIDRVNLRQGDIFQGIPFPLLQLTDFTVLSRTTTTEDASVVPKAEILPKEHRGDPNWGFTAQIGMRLCFAVVLSNCCELELRNGRFLPPAFIIGRIREVPPAIRQNPEKFQSLRLNKDRTCLPRLSI